MAISKILWVIIRTREERHGLANDLVENAPLNKVDLCSYRDACELLGALAGHAGFV